MSNEYILFTGCSYTRGIGFDLEDKSPDLWVNIVHQENFNSTVLINASSGGRSNAGIFQDTVSNLLKYKPKYAIVQWTSMPRIEIDTGLELYATRCVLMPNSPLRDYNNNSYTITKEYIESIRDRLITTIHLHSEIVNLVNYVNSLVELAKVTDTKICFINGLCDWDNNYFTRLSNFLPDQLTPVTAKLINIKNRDDEEIFAIYKKMHDNYDSNGSICKEYWVNLYSSLYSTRVDTNSDNMHPGKKSNLYYSNLVKNWLQIKKW